MRTPAENKGTTAPGTTPRTCPLCTRPVSHYGCRHVPLGWFCLADGLKIDPEGVIHPTPDPVGKREQEVIEQFAPLLAEAGSDVDAALEAYTQAQRAHSEAVLACAEAGVQDEHTPVVFGMQGPTQIGGPQRRVKAADRARLLGTEERLRQAREDTARHLQQARVRHHRLTSQHGDTRITARQRDRDSA
jgi:hypothetical protein